jgi:hypothetical protein
MYGGSWNSLLLAAIERVRNNSFRLFLFRTKTFSDLESQVADRFDRLAMENTHYIWSE